MYKYILPMYNYTIIMIYRSKVHEAQPQCA